MITPASNSASRTGGTRFPEYPDLPDAYKDDKDMVSWHEQQSRMWDQFRLCLDRSGVGSSAASQSATSTATATSASALPVEATSGYTIVVSNESHAVACDADGNPNLGELGVAGSAKTVVSVFRGITPLSATLGPPSAQQFRVTIGSPVNCTATKEAANTIRCDTLTSDSGTIPFSVDVGGFFNVGKVFTLTKSKSGAVGAPGDSVAGLDAKLVVITSDSQTFQIAKSGTISPESIRFTVVGQNLEGAPVITVTAGTATLTGTGLIRDLDFTDMTSDAISVSVDWDGQSDTISVVKVREGSDSVTAFLTNESHIVPSSSTGVVSSFSGAVTDMIVFIGASDTTALWTYSITTNIGVTGSFGTGAQKNRYTVTSLSDVVGYVDITASRTGFASVTKRFTIAKSIAGARGDNGSPGAAGDSMIVEYSTDGSSWHTTFATGDIYRREKIGASGTFTSAIRIVGTDGERGSRSFYGTTTITAASGGWDAMVSGAKQGDTRADAVLAATGYTKVTIDQVTLYNTTAPGWAETRFWNGTTWVLVNQVIDGNLVVHGTIGTDQLVAGISISSPIVIGGTLKLSGASKICNTTTNASDNGIIRVNGGGSDSQDRGGQIDFIGNEYIAVGIDAQTSGYLQLGTSYIITFCPPDADFTGLGASSNSVNTAFVATSSGIPTWGTGGQVKQTIGGSILITPGNHENGSVRIRDRAGLDRIVVGKNGNVTLGSDVDILAPSGISFPLSITQSSSPRFVVAVAGSAGTASVYSGSNATITLNGSSGNVSALNSFTVGSNVVVGARKDGVTAADSSAAVDADTTTVSTTLGTSSSLAGSETVSLSALYSYLNALGAVFNANATKQNGNAAKQNANAVLQNTLRDRLKVSGGHGLISD